MVEGAGRLVDGARGSGWSSGLGMSRCSFRRALTLTVMNAHRHPVRSVSENLRATYFGGRTPANSCAFEQLSSSAQSAWPLVLGVWVNVPWSESPLEVAASFVLMV